MAFAVWNLKQLFFPYKCMGPSIHLDLLCLEAKDGKTCIWILVLFLA